jgi:hypothetical protein
MQERDEKKTWTAFAYCSPQIKKKFIKLFKYTNTGLAFRNTNTLQQLTKPNTQKPEHDKSGVLNLK